MSFLASIIALVSRLLACSVIHDGWVWHVTPITGVCAPHFLTIFAIGIMWHLFVLNLSQHAVISAFATEAVSDEVKAKADLVRAVMYPIVVVIAWGILYMLA